MLLIPTVKNVNLVMCLTFECITKYILLTTVFLWLISPMQESLPSSAKNKKYSELLKEREALHLYKQ